MPIAYSVPTACRIAGVPVEAGEKWIFIGLIPIEVEKRRHTVGLRGLLAIDLARRLRAQKVSVPTISRLTNYLHAVTDEQLTDSIEAGRSILVSTSADAHATLVSAADSIHNTTGRDVLLIAIDLAVCLKRIRESIAEFAVSAEVTQGN